MLAGVLYSRIRIAYGISLGVCLENSKILYGGRFDTFIFPCVRTLGSWEKHVLKITTFMRREGIWSEEEKIAWYLDLLWYLASKSGWQKQTTGELVGYCWSHSLFHLAWGAAGHSLIAALCSLAADKFLFFFFNWLGLYFVGFGSLIILLIFPQWV